MIFCRTAVEQGFVRNQSVQILDKRVTMVAFDITWYLHVCIHVSCMCPKNGPTENIPDRKPDQNLDQALDLNLDQTLEQTRVQTLEQKI